MLKILALDTSTDACSVAILADGESHQRFVIAKQQHTKLVLPMIQELLAETQLTLKQLDAIAFGCGPGSFTGVRLAASIVQSLAFTTDLPVVKISTLRLLAQEAYARFDKPKVIVAQDARMQELYWGEYQVDVDGVMQPISPDRLIAPEKVKIIADDDFIGVGTGWKIYGDILVKHCNNVSKVDLSIYPQASYVAQLAVTDFTKGLAVSAAEALPTYLREEVAWVKK